MIACLHPVGSCPQRRDSRHLLKFMTQTAGRVSLEAADDSVGGKRWRGHDGDVYAIGENSDVLEVDREHPGGLADKRFEPLRCLPPETWLGAHWAPHEVVSDDLIHEKPVDAPCLATQLYRQGQSM